MWVNRLTLIVLVGLLIFIVYQSYESSPPPHPEKSTAELCAPYPRFHGQLIAFNKAVRIGDALGCTVYAVTEINGGGIFPDQKAENTAVASLKRRYPSIPDACAEQLIDDGFERYLLAEDEEHKAAGKLCVELMNKVYEKQQYETEQGEAARELEEK